MMRGLAAILLLLVVAGFSVTASGQVVPGQADISRYPKNIQKPPAMPNAPPHAAQQPPPQPSNVPPGAEKMLFVLHELRINGVSAYTMQDLWPIWQKDLGNTISILRLYQIATEITARYRQDGYVLSRAFIPAQEIGDGVAHIEVVEGYVADVRFEGKMPSSTLLREARYTLMSERPLNIKTLERQMLLLNDLPGTDFRSILRPLNEPVPAAPQAAPAPNAPPQPAPAVKPPAQGVPMAKNTGDGGVVEALALVPPRRPPDARLPADLADAYDDWDHLAEVTPYEPEPSRDDATAADLAATEPAAGPAPLPPQADAPQRSADDGGVALLIVGIPRPQLHGSVSVDNAGSKYIGPWSANAHVDIANTLTHYDQTSLTLSSDFGSELRNIEISHMIPLNANGLKLIATVGYTKGHPGYTLEPTDVRSDTLRAGLGCGLDVIRQRGENLNVYSGIDYQDADTDVLGGLPFVRDHTRTFKVVGHFDKQDQYRGSSVIEATFSKGLGIAGASAPHSVMLSRAEGRADYAKIEASLYRFQQLGDEWAAVFGATGQYSARPLLSAEEFGFGGQAFGRAYDPSELVGDQGCAFKAEIHYDGLVDIYDGRHAQPYVFYDIGKIWNLDPGEPARDSGASAGAGLRYPLPFDVNADVSLAEPLTRRADAPQYGNGKAPRFVFSLNSTFTH